LVDTPDALSISVGAAKRRADPERRKKSVDVYDSEYRRQYCRERIDRIRDDYRRAQASPRESPHGVVSHIRSVIERARRQIPRREPAYRS
jgi:hypothetical protein